MFTSEQLSGGNVTVDGVDADANVLLFKSSDFTSKYGKNGDFTFVSKMPYEFSSSNGVSQCNVYDGFIFDNNNNRAYLATYKQQSAGSDQYINGFYLNNLDGKGWIPIGIPSSGIAGSGSNVKLLLVESDLHVFKAGRYYKYTPETNLWVTMPQQSYSDSDGAYYFDNKIHLYDGTVIYCFNGSSWTKLSTSLPVSNGKAIVYKNTLYYVKGNTTYKLVDGSWIETDNISNFSLAASSCVYVYNDKIYTFSCITEVNDDPDSSDKYGYKDILSINVYDGEKINVNNILWTLSTSSSWPYTSVIRQLFISNGDMYLITALYRILKSGAVKPLYYGFEEGEQVWLDLGTTMSSIIPK